MFEELTGRKQHLILDDPLRKRGVELWLRRVLTYYGEDGGVDVEIIDGQLLLTEKTADHIYNGFTPPKLSYRPGSRPFLERLLGGIVRDGMSDRERALAILRRVRDNRDSGLAGRVRFDGGTEEELVKRGASMCNEVARLFIVLAQVSGMPARFIGHHISGHATVEVLVGGEWWWMDVQKGMYCLGPGGEVLSVRDILRDPTVFERQAEAVWRDFRPTGPFSTDGKHLRQRAFNIARGRDCYFFAKETVCVGNYYVWEQDRYSYPWTAEAHDPEGRAEAVRLENLNRKALGWPDYYFNHMLFDEEFKSAG